MKLRKLVPAAVAAILGLGAVTAAQAGMFDMMNPNRWFGDRDHDRYRYGGYGPYGGGYGPYGYGAPYGWGGPYGGWGGPYGGWGGYNRPSTIVVNPSNGSGEQPKLPE